MGAVVREEGVCGVGAGSRPRSRWIWSALSGGAVSTIWRMCSARALARLVRASVAGPFGGRLGSYGGLVAAWLWRAVTVWCLVCHCAWSEVGVLSQRR